jgi:AcrR family transcriptional regulator
LVIRVSSSPAPSHLPRRRTPERILTAALDHFNRYGEPQVSTHLVAAALGLSTGNLHYHFRSKDDLILALYGRYEAALQARLSEAAGVVDPAALVSWLGRVFEVHWRYRFLLRDMASLLTRHHSLEVQLPALLSSQALALRTGLCAARQSQEPPAALVEALHLALIHGVAHAYLQDPRRALENEQQAHTQALLMHHLQGLLALPAGH